jgi:hypothetical protein
MGNVSGVKRILLLCLTMTALVIPAAAHGAVPCRDKIYNEWYASGKISTTYPIACYHDALANIPGDAQVYSNLGSDIKAALQGALAGTKGAVGHGLASTLSTTGQTKGAIKTQHDESVLAAPASATSGGGVPLPIIVLAAVAILLAGAGAVGTGVKQYRKRSTS